MSSQKKRIEFNPDTGRLEVRRFELNPYAVIGGGLFRVFEGLSIRGRRIFAAAMAGVIILFVFAVIHSADHRYPLDHAYVCFRSSVYGNPEIVHSIPSGYAARGFLRSSARLDRNGLPVDSLSTDTALLNQFELYAAEHSEFIYLSGAGPGQTVRYRLQRVLTRNAAPPSAMPRADSLIFFTTASYDSKEGRCPLF